MRPSEGGEPSVSVPNTTGPSVTPLARTRQAVARRAVTFGINARRLPVLYFIIMRALTRWCSLCAGRTEASRRRKLGPTVSSRCHPILADITIIFRGRVLYTKDRGPFQWTALVNSLQQRNRSVIMSTAAVWMSRVPTVLSLQQLVEEQGPPELQPTVPRPEAAVSDVLGAALPRLTFALERRGNAEKKRVRSFGDLGALVPDVGGDPAGCASSTLSPPP